MAEYSDPDITIWPKASDHTNAKFPYEKPYVYSGQTVHMPDIITSLPKIEAHANKIADRRRAFSCAYSGHTYSGLDQAINQISTQLRASGMPVTYIDRLIFDLLSAAATDLIL